MSKYDCNRAPKGWWCSRFRDHDGPCAAWPRLWRHPILWWRFTKR